MSKKKKIPYNTFNQFWGFRICSDETVELLSKHMKRHAINEKDKRRNRVPAFECLIKEDIGLTDDERDVLLSIKTKAVSRDRLVY